MELKSTGRFTSNLRKLSHYRFDRCSECGTKFEGEHPAYAGYKADGTEAYVGECCKAQLVELASHIYWYWSKYKRPEGRAPMWRYMEFSKFVALLKAKALYFARADKLGDPFEGARGIRSREWEWKEYSVEYFKHAMRTVPGGPSKEELATIDARAEQLYKEMEEISKKELLNTYVTCWHGNDTESEALWRLYCPPPSVGVAIRTDFLSLSIELKADQHDVKFGHVQYINFREHFAGTYDRIFWKRNSLAHEAELRGVIHDWRRDQPEARGIAVPIDLRFMHRVVMSPFAPSWFEGVLKDVMVKYGMDLTPSPSELAAEPFF